jgi:ABC-2 type transport system permease protein
MAQEEYVPAVEEPEAKRGIGGWLLLFAVATVLIPVRGAAGLILYLWKADQPDAFAVACLALVALFGGLLVYALFTRRRVMPALVAGFWAMAFLIALANVFGRWEIPWVRDPGMARLLRLVALPQVVIGAAIWIAYFCVSKRVKATLVEPFGVVENLATLVRREVSSYFVSPIAYVAMAMFLLAAGVMFGMPFFGALRPGAPADMRSLFSFGIVTFFLLVASSLLTMRSLAEEQRTGTIETLMTAPVTDGEVVVGKFLGCWVVYLVMIAPTLLYTVLLAVFGNPDPGPIAAGYFGLALQGALYVAVGLLASSLTRNQVVAAVVAFFVLLVMTLLWPIGSFPPPPWRYILQQASIPAHYQGFSEGVVDLVHILYFVLVTALVLFITVKVLESRRWR